MQTDIKLGKLWFGTCDLTNKNDFTFHVHKITFDLSKTPDSLDIEFFIYEEDIVNRGNTLLSKKYTVDIETGKNCTITNYIFADTISFKVTDILDFIKQFKKSSECITDTMYFSTLFNSIIRPELLNNDKYEKFLKEYPSIRETVITNSDELKEYYEDTKTES